MYSNDTSLNKYLDNMFTYQYLLTSEFRCDVQKVSLADESHVIQMSCFGT
jgi:hypothetical protein